jgi:hypothetical protein
MTTIIYCAETVQKKTWLKFESFYCLYVAVLLFVIKPKFVHYLSAEVAVGRPLSVI